MATIQRQFEVFDEKIRLKRFEENEVLREKRDIIRKRLNERLPEVFEKYKENTPSYRFRDQGSYEMGTGVIPLDGDYDIDQGLYFDISSEDYPDPVLLKERVCEALAGHTKSVKIRRSCVTVQYQKEGAPLYHVDLAVYSDKNKNIDGKSRLAVGKENSGEEYRLWWISDPETLSDLIFERFKGTDGQQFRRIVRYLKRWKAKNFPSTGHAAPLGIAITVAAYLYLRNYYLDPLTRKPDDVSSLQSLVTGLLDHFNLVWSNETGNLVRRLVVSLPVEPYSDLCERMTDSQMASFEEKLKRLREALDGAVKEVAPEEACKLLQKEFGQEFPIPEKEETAKKTASAIVSSSNSA